MKKDGFIKLTLILVAGAIGGYAATFLYLDITTQSPILKQFSQTNAPHAGPIEWLSTPRVISTLMGVISAFILVFFVTIVDFGTPTKLFALALVGGLAWQSIVEEGVKTILRMKSPALITENRTEPEPNTDPPPVIDKGSGRSKITESMFCLDMKRPECVAPADLTEVYLNDVQTTEDGVRKLFFWTSMQTNQDLQNVVHIWLSSERPDEWPEIVYIWIHEKVNKFTAEDKIRLERRLSEIDKTNPNMHAVQAVILSLDPSSRFRTYSSLRAVPGRYSVEVWDPDSLQVVSGGEAKIILIKSSSDSN